MPRFLTGNVWVDEVFYTEGMAESQVGSAAGAIGDHLWRVVDDPADLQPVPEPEPLVEVPAPAEVVTDDDPKPAAEPGEVVLPGPEPEVPAPVDAPKPPPQSGRGSTESAWREYALSVGVHVDEANDRSEVIATIEAAGKPV